MLLILIQKVVEDLLVKKGDTLEIISGSWLKTYDFIDESVGLVGKVGDVLLSLHLLFYICRIVTDL